MENQNRKQKGEEHFLFAELQLRLAVPKLSLGEETNLFLTN